jgi:hypothetical protein
MEVVKDLGIRKTKAGYRKRYVVAKCSYCGSEKEYTENSIKTGNTKSCGCERYTINLKALTRQSEYALLQNIKTRCYNKNRDYYYLYGGRGISVCKEWLESPESFISWARLNGYKKGLYIDRINPNGNYEPSNCRFVDAKINSRNTRVLSVSNSSGYRGVTAKKEKNGNTKWRARVGIDGKNISLGVYVDKKQAALAYNNYVIDNNTGHTINNIEHDKKSRI